MWHGAGDRSPTLRKGLLGIYNIHQTMPADGTLSLTSIQGTAHTLMNHPACETSRRQFIDGPRFEPRLDRLEVSGCTFKPSCQPCLEHTHHTV